MERVNRTFGADVLATSRYPDLASCQAAFDTWRTCYNHERPHDSLDLDAPAKHYVMSTRTFPETLPPLTYEEEDLIRKVSSNGEIHFKTERHFVSEALPGELVALRPTLVDRVWTVYFAHQKLKEIDERN